MFVSANFIYGVYHKYNQTVYLDLTSLPMHHRVV